MRQTLCLFNESTAKLWLESLTSSKLPKSNFSVTYSRSSGPGGQKVNKTSSKSTITLPNFQYNEWIPWEIRQQLIEKNFRYLRKSGSVVISSDVSRNQQDNLDLCFDKFCNELKKTVFFASEIDEDDLKKWENVRKKTNEKRLIGKKFRAQKKQARKVDY